MKCTSMIAAGLAAVATAAPAATKVEARSSFDIANQFNGLDFFGNNDLNYLLAVNNLNLDIFGQLALNQNFNLLAFQGLFQQNALFDVQNLLLLQQLFDVQNFANVGLFGNFDLNALQFGGLNLGVQGIGGLGLNQFIDQNAFGQINQVISSKGFGVFKE